MVVKLTLYGLKPHLAPNPWKPALLLQLLGLDYEIKLLDFGSDNKETGVKGAECVACLCIWTLTKIAI